MRKRIITLIFLSLTFQLTIDSDLIEELENGPEEVKEDEILVFDYTDEDEFLIEHTCPEEFSQDACDDPY